MQPAQTNSLLSGLFSTSAAAQLFSDVSRVQAMLDVEAALAQVEASLGIIPASSAELIASCCRVDGIDFARLGAELAASGNLAIPLVKQLTERVRERSPEAAGHVHWGATSQDILDTGLVLQLRETFAATDRMLERISALLANLTRVHVTSVMAGRTWMQHAVPVTFGLKTAGWLSALLRDCERLDQMRRRVLVVQFGGAAGTLASLGEQGLAVGDALAELLQLGKPDAPWHSMRDRMAEVAAMYGILAGSVSKMGRDLSLLMQTETGEVSEGITPGRGGSSTMPHKRNPVGVAALLACTQRVPALVATMLSVMAQENERGLGNWGSEWATLPELCALVISALEHLESVLSGLHVYPEVMRRNLNLTHGLLFAEAVSYRIAPRVGRDRAHHLLQAAACRAVQSGFSLRDVVASDAELAGVLSVAELDALFDPTAYLGSSAAIIERVLTGYLDRYGKAAP